MLSKTDDRSASARHALLAATFVLAAALRFVRLDSGLWYDEIATLVQSVRHPLLQIVTQFPGVNDHPLYSVLAHLSIGAFGESPWSLRLPACLFGVATVVMVYVLGTTLMPRAEAWVASLFLATSYHHVWFSQNARGYTMLAFFALLSVYLLVRALTGWRVMTCVAYVVVCVAGIYTHLTMVLLVVCQAAAVLLAHVLRDRRASDQALMQLTWSWAAIVIASVAAYAPMFGGLIAAFSGAEREQSARVATPAWAAGEMVRSLFADAGFVVTLASAVFALVGLGSLWRRYRLAVAMLIAPAVILTLGLVAVKQPMRPRFFFFASGAAALFAAHGLGVTAASLARRSAFRSIGKGPLLGSLAAVLVALSVVSLPRNYRLPKQDFDGAVRFLDAVESNGTRVAMIGPACLALARYYEKTWPCIGRVDELHAMGENGQRLVVVHTLTEFTDPNLSARLRADCPVVQRFAGTVGFGDIVVCDATRRHE